MTFKLKVGPSSGNFAAGVSIGDVREAQSGGYNISPDAVAILNGQVANEDAILKDGDKLVFRTDTGQKG